MAEAKVIRFGTSTIVLEHVTHYERYASGGLTIYFSGGDSLICPSAESAEVAAYLDRFFAPHELTARPAPAAAPR